MSRLICTRSSAASNFVTHKNSRYSTRINNSRHAPNRHRVGHHRRTSRCCNPCSSVSDGIYHYVSDRSRSHIAPMMTQFQPSNPKADKSQPRRWTRTTQCEATTDVVHSIPVSRFCLLFLLYGCCQRPLCFTQCVYSTLSARRRQGGLDHSVLDLRRPDHDARG